MMFWLNGVERSVDDPQLSPLDRGFTLADGLFETMRATNGVIFRLDAHLDRLCIGARILGIPIPPTLRDHVAASARAAFAAGYVHASVRLTVTRGPAPPGLAPPPHSAPTIALAISPLSPPQSPRPIVAAMASARRNEYALTSGIKTLSYTESVLALAQAKLAGADDAIFLDTSGHIADATASNLFAFIGDTLVTPALSCGVLPGITRAVVLDLAQTLGVNTSEREIPEAEIALATEIFLTSSIREIAPVVRISTTAIGSGRCGPLTQKLIDAYAALVREECGA
ncbi:MAG: aminotransferase class IV [Gemmatimonadaceae bacterium]|nr:aminotransferase class IV [Gemmatimonadaceae bacterium]